MRKILVWLSLIVILSTLAGCLLWRAVQPRISYNEQIRPIFNQKCLACHGGVKQSGGFSLLFPEEALDTTDSGKPAIIPGDAANSELVRRLHETDPETRMPYESEPLNEAEIELIERWIDQGAEWETHWAYVQPDASISPPKLKNWGSNEVDAFIFQQLAQQELSPNPPAEQSPLLRRLSLDLIGLPPSPEEMQAFLENPSPDAYAQEVERLLASPHFGEKWASMWLDLARYADSKGYEKDLYRSIWKYRDWVIQALNEDLPFDQFTVEQLAGDLLPQPDESQYLATAFHRNTMANDEGGTNDEEFRTYANIERVGTTFEVWQGTTMACVQCHSHPYDPIRHEEFYEFLAFFNNTEDTDIYHEGPNLLTYEGEDREQVVELLDWFEKNLAEELAFRRDTFLADQVADVFSQVGYRRQQAELFDASSSLIELTAPEQKSVFQIQDTSWIRFDAVDLSEVQALTYRYVTPYSGFIEVRLGSQTGPRISRTALPATAKESDRKRWETWADRRVPIQATEGVHDVYLVFHKDRHQHQDLFRLDWIDFHEKQPLLNRLNPEARNKLQQLADIKPTPTPILRDLPPEKQRSTHLFRRGNRLSLGEEVQADVPEFLGRLSEASEPNRLAMARWLTSPENPLTARVMVNRVWGQLFGTGIVETAEDFGTQGTAPSHPDLLDWLAVQFQREDRWQPKALLRRLVLSETYQQSARVSAEQLAKDSRNRYLGRAPRLRLSAEQLRDQVLHVSGLLNPKLLGPSVRPPLPEGMASFGFGDRWEVSDSADQYRRSLYTYLKRTNPFPNRITFDGTDRTVCTSRRIRTNTPLQALAFLNDEKVLEAAAALAKYMKRQPADQQIFAGYERVMLRPISAGKAADLQAFYQETLLHFQQQPDQVCALLPQEPEADEQLAALTILGNALLNLDEFLTR